MTDKPYEWAGEHFCKPDVTALYHGEPARIHTIGYPVELDANPEPPTFCSSCLCWFDDPATIGSDLRPPQQEDST